MDTQNKRVLIVDDDDTARWIGERIMKKVGYQVFTAINGEDGLHKAREIQPDLIILDIMMPKMNGYDVFKYLKDSPSTANIKVIMLSAKGDTMNVGSGGKATIAGFAVDRFLNKPVSVEELVAHVKALL